MYSSIAGFPIDDLSCGKCILVPGLLVVITPTFKQDLILGIFQLNAFNFCGDEIMEFDLKGLTA